MNVHILERDGKPAFAILPMEEYERLIEALEDAADASVIDAFARDLAAGREETFPAEIADRLLDGENPVRVLRAHRGLTLVQLAERCQVTAAHVSQVEKGARSMSVALLKKMALALGVDPELLLDWP